jgi:hypothetical protein
MSRYSPVQSKRPLGPVDRADAITRSLLGWGVVAGPFYLVVGFVQAVTRHGFDLAHDDLSLLANGSLGWLQIANLVLSGLMTIAAAVGVRRASGSRWGARLLAGYGVGLVAAGVCTADPANGFPPGSADETSWHGLLHVVAGGLGFVGLVGACFVMAGYFGARARYSRVSGVLFLVSFAAVASGSSATPVVLGFWVGVIIAWAWLAALCVHLYRATPIPGRGAA